MVKDDSETTTQWIQEIEMPAALISYILFTVALNDILHES